MQALVSSAQMKEIDQKAISELGMPELLLMEHAALGVVKALEQRFGSLLSDTSGVILAGVGNNGGDALAVARLLSSLGLQKLFVAVIGSEKALSHSAAAQVKFLSKLGVPIFWPKKTDSEIFKNCDWIVDGLFGTGLSRPVKEPYASWINKINEFAQKKWILSIDIPSGLSSDSGNPLGVAVRASQTVTLGFMKKGLVTAAAGDYVGKLSLEPIQIPRLIPFPVDAFLYEREDAARLPKRRPTSHKGSFGHVFIWASEETKQGACILSALGALRSGAGLVTIVGESKKIDSLKSRLPPEVMTENVDFEEIGPFFEKQKGVLVIGPGMGLVKGWKPLKCVLQAALGQDWKVVLDADGLSLLAENQSELKALRKYLSGSRLILTPHPKEASRLLGLSVSEIEADRYCAAQKLAQLYSSTIVLKGKGTLVQIPDHPCSAVRSGDTGLSKGGTGDLLSGILAALLAQSLPMEQAIPLGVYIHGRVSERVTQIFGMERSTLPTDLASFLPEVFKEIES